jgi:peptidoglycan glycosyltransferase
MERRIRRLGVFMALCFIALFIQLNNIQVIKASSLANNPANPRVVAAQLSQPRGDILSADGVNLATSVQAKTGAYKYRRVYNTNTAALFSQIVGYDTIFGTRTGVEATYNGFLQAHTRPATSLRDLLVNRTTTDNVTLTINSHLQLQVAAIMDQVGAQNSAPLKEEGAVVLNPKTGAVLAMYSNPTYDPNPLASTSSSAVTAAYNKLDPSSGSSPLVSRTFQRGFLPGSTFKAVTSAAIFDHQPALAKVDIPTATCIPLPQSPLKLCNYGHNGPSGPESCGGTLVITLPASCDTAFAQYGMALGASNLTNEAQAFGFNQQIPIDLPGVAVSYFPPDQPGLPNTLYNNKPSQAYSAFGQQDVTATALQMAVVAAGIANQGVIMTPHVMEQIRDTQGNLVQAYAPKPWLTATSSTTASAVTSLMQAVATSGTAKGVFPASWNVAAKTGTAETGPGATLTNDWMIAFAPANDPKVAVAVVVPNQPGTDTGATVSGPPMKAILGDALGLTP